MNREVRDSLAQVQAIFWRVRLAYHMRRFGMVKRRWSALPSIWEETGEDHWQIYYEAGETPMDAIIEDASYGSDSL